RLMAGRVPRRRDDLHGAVAEHVAVARQLLDLLSRDETWLGGTGHRPVVFRSLDQHGRGREERDVAHVVAVRVRHRGVGYVGRLGPNLLELGRQGLGAAVGDGAVGDDHAVGHRRDRVGDARVPEQEAPIVPDQVAVVGELDGLARVDARRPPRLVLADVLPAVEDVEPLDAGARRAPAEAERRRHRRDERYHCLAAHGCSARVRLYRADRGRTIPGMARTRHRPVCGAVVALALLGSSVRAQTAGVPEVVEKLLQGFSSPDCLRRWQAIEEYTDRMIGRVSSYKEPVAEVPAGLGEQAAAKGPAVEQKVQMVAGYADEASAAFARLAKISASFDRSGPPLAVWRRGLPPLTKVLDAPAEPFMTRRLAAGVIAESASKSSIARNAGWSEPLPRLLASQDPTARLLGSIIAALGGFLSNQSPTKGQIVPELLRGLDADSFAARYESTRALLTVSKQPVDRHCVDPSDRAPDRAGGVQAWQTWSEQGKARLAAGEIGQ